MSKRTTRTAKSVADEGVSPDLDLGNVGDPTPEMHAELDKALDDAGILFSDDSSSPAPADPIEPIADPIDPASPADPAPADPVDPTPPADPVEPSADPVPPADPAVTETPEETERKRVEDLKSIDLDKVEPPAGVSPRNLVNFDKLREIAKLRTQEAEELKGKLEEATKNPQVSALAEEEKKELEELRSFRKIFDTENDPEFKKQYEEKLSSVDEDLLSILKKNGLNASTEESIRKMGVGNVSSKFWENEILPRLPLIDQERIRRRLAERADVSDQRSREIEKFQSQRETVLQEREQKQSEQFRQEQDAVIKHVEDLRKDIPWARKMEIPAKATKEEITRIEAHNKHVEELEFRFQDALYPANPQARAEIAAAAVASTVLAASVQDLGARLQAANELIKQRDAELAKIKSAGRIPSGESEPRRSRAEQPESFKSDDEAIEAGLAAAESSL